jgi:hypothetical protein
MMRRIERVLMTVEVTGDGVFGVVMSVVFAPSRGSVRLDGALLGDAISPG